MKIVQQWKYKVAIVQAIQLKDCHTDATIEVPRWLLQNIELTTDADESSWLVQKPDGSVAVYTDENFRKEFEQ